MSGIRSVVTRFLENHGWNYFHLNDGGSMMFNINAGERNHRLVFDIKEAIGVLILYLLHPHNVDIDKRGEMAEFITRANYGLIAGNFEMDFGDGDLRFKVSIDVEDGQLSETMVLNMVTGAVNLVNRYYTGMMSVQYGNIPVKDAIRQAERSEVDHVPDSESPAPSGLSILN